MSTTWTTRDGRLLPVQEMDNRHLLSAIQMGMRAAARKIRSDALEQLGYTMQGDGGTEYLGEVEYESALQKASSPTYLARALKSSKRYAPLVEEAQRRGLRLSTRRMATH